MSIPSEFDKKLQAEQLRRHQAAVPQSVLVAAFAGLAVLAVLWNHVAERSVLAWIACLPFALAFRLGVAQAHARAPTAAATAQTWLWAYRISLAFHGTVWAVISLSIWPHIDTTVSSLLGLALFAVAIVSLMVIAYDAVSALAFAIPALSPLSSFMLNNAAQNSLELRLTVSCLLGMALVQVWRANRSFQNEVLNNLREAEHNREFTEKTAQMADTQRALSEKSAVLSVLMETSQQGFWFLDSQGITRDINPAMCKKLGRSRDEVIGHHIDEFFAGEDLRLIQQEQSIRQHGASGRFEVGLTRPDGGRAYFLVDATVMLEDDMSVRGSVGVWTDVTQRRLDHMALRIYEVTVNSITDMVSVVDEDNVYRLANDAWCKFMGFDRQNVLGRKTREVFVNGTTAERRMAITACIDTQQVQRVTGTVNLPGLVGKILETTYHPYTDSFDGARCAVLVTRDVTARQMAEEKLQSMSQDLIRKTDELNVAMENIAQGFISYEANGHITVFNQRALALLELPASLMTEDVSYQTVQQYQLERGDLVGMQSVVDETGILRYFPTGDANSLKNYVRQTRSGRMIEVHTQDLANGGWVRTFTDVTPYLKSLQDLRDSETEKSAILNSFPGYISAFDQSFVYTYVNKAFADYRGLEPDQIVGQHMAAILGKSNYLVSCQEIVHASSLGTSCREFRVMNTPSGKPLDLEVTHICGTYKADGTQTHYSFAIDITDRKRAEAKIAELAFFDQLTGLPNRTLLADRLKQSVAANTRQTQRGAVLLIDLDNFKALNDTMGHDVGDLLLQQVATRLLTCVREGDTVARIGGDEFVIVLVGLDTELTGAAAAIQWVAQKISDSLGQAYLLNERTYHCSASMGATLFSADATSIDELLKQADLAMYSAKDSGRNALRFFDQSMQLDMVERSALESDLRRAITASEFELYYQPQVDRRGDVAGCEALIRWHHPDKGLLTPAGFITTAEDSGLILPIGAWVIDQACKQLVKWSEQPRFAHLVIAVNVSAKQMRQSQFVGDVIAALERTGANPKLLKLELTESVLVANMEDVIAKMNTLRAMGIGLSLDDFGTGFSSLSYLSRLPLDQIKIDRSFVSNIEHREDAVAICAATISLAHALKLQVVAEGVETEAQRYVLSTVHSCDFLQGYLFSRPLAITAFEAKFSANRA